MGGHDFGERAKIPDYRIYKVDENCPELLQLQKALASKGLKDPWIRNEVWRFDVREWGTPVERLTSTVFRGLKWGIIAFVATVAVETAIDMMSEKKDGHHSHH